MNYKTYDLMRLDGGRLACCESYEAATGDLAEIEGELFRVDAVEHGVFASTINVVCPDFCSALYRPVWTDAPDSDAEEEK